MIIVYRKDTKEIVNGCNTNSLFPDGGPARPHLEIAVSEYGGNISDYGVFRLHDIEQADLVSKCFTHDYFLTLGNNGEPVGVSFSEKQQQIEVEPPTQEERLEALEAAMLELVLGGGA